MNQVLAFLPYCEAKLEQLAIQHTPEGSAPRAVVDQWLFALATDSHLYCDKAVSNEADLRAQIIGELGDQPDIQKKLVQALDIAPLSDKAFTFIDLFAGIGGVRLGFENAGGTCVFSSEFDGKAQITYQQNHGDFPFGDITKITKGAGSSNIPDHDVLLGGFPCQAFSVAGYRQGFNDEQGRGNLFFNIYEILKEKRPKAFLLENVKNLETHDNRNTFKTITHYLKSLGYSVIFKVMNSMEYGNVPQTRERIYIVGFRGESDWEENDGSLTSQFKWPEKEQRTVTIRDILEKEVDEQFYYEKYACHETLKKYMLSPDTVYQWRRHYVRENKSNVCPTLTANMGTGGHNVPLILDNDRIRKLTPKECSLVQGFPADFQLPKGMANSHLYKQFGNSVTVPVVKKIANEIASLIAQK